MEGKKRKQRLVGLFGAFRSDRSSLGTQPCPSSRWQTHTQTKTVSTDSPRDESVMFCYTYDPHPPPTPSQPSLPPSLLYSFVAAKVPARFNICGFTGCFIALLQACNVRLNSCVLKQRGDDKNSERQSWRQQKWEERLFSLSFHNYILI